MTWTNKWCKGSLVMMAQIMLFRCSDQERVAQPAAAHFLRQGRCYNILHNLMKQD